MLHTGCHPVYKGFVLPWQERLQFGRRYGKYDFGRFERLETSNHYIGKGKIGDVEVACKFLFRESRWGVLGPNRNPGGVIYIDLTFTESSNCRLRGATVTLTLDEEDKDLRHHFRTGNPPTTPRVPVHIRQFGPRSLRGQLDEVFRITKHRGSPWVKVGGIGGVGGIGRDSVKRYTQRNQWRFSSNPMPNKLGTTAILKWNLIENELDRQPGHENTFHTAFAFEHDGQPFLMQVEVSGYLEGVASDLQHKVKKTFKKFKFPIEQQTATTLINFGGRDHESFQDPLDDLATNIPANMEEKNKMSASRSSHTPLDPRPYEEDTEDNDDSLIQEGGEDDDSIETSSTAFLEEIQGEATMLLSLDTSSTSQHSLAEISEALSKTNREYPETTIRESPTPGSQVGSSIDATTLAGQEQDGVIGKIELMELPENHEKIQRVLEETTIPTVFQIMILWIFAVGVKMSLLSTRGTLRRGTAS
ncbi:uncharacterized protein F4822DRAFT_410101 [Hypoxylon trugodes]|uniref:uncharacterized protein n=1 Tax=Hypoxylon trugodes TaxID=326681 RepID=UPI00219603E0|nr:uncharacterized protein F4822DRAFT_410101 [Hypoxylon trugodes]KAI1386451.1 hypothetical protein F4822DRAFT_410101 [Hypoxylon trugodes]